MFYSASSAFQPVTPQPPPPMLSMPSQPHTLYPSGRTAPLGKEAHPVAQVALSQIFASVPQGYFPNSVTVSPHPQSGLTESLPLPAPATEISSSHAPSERTPPQRQERTFEFFLDCFDIPHPSHSFDCYLHALSERIPVILRSFQGSTILPDHLKVHFIKGVENPCTNTSHNFIEGLLETANALSLLSAFWNEKNGAPRLDRSSGIWENEKILTDWIKNGPAIKDLDCSNSNMTCVPHQFSEFLEIETLNLRGTKIVCISSKTPFPKKVGKLLI